MRIAIHGRYFDNATREYIELIFNELNSRNIDILISEKFILDNKDSEFDFAKYPVFQNNTHLKGTDYTFSLGGDGTLLNTVSYVNELEIPILGINLGTLGFLATISKNNIKQALNQFFNQEFSLDERILIHVDNSDNIFGKQNFAMNEVAILKRDTSSMIAINCEISGEFVNTYWADGLMVATPTGSTGYSLSCGGPLVLPQSDSFIITPISPHNLNVRPLIVSGNNTISLEIGGKGRNFLTSLDSISYKIDNSIKISLKKEKFKAKLIKLKGYHFFDTLRQKLNWGLDIRN